ncbi:hypothetical protein Trydic_g3979 [Trypoxylus dichotomus]
MSNAITRTFRPNFNVKCRSVNRDENVFKKKTGDLMANNFVFSFPADSAEHGDANNTNISSCSVLKAAEEYLPKTLKIMNKKSTKQNRELRTSHSQALINAAFSSQSPDHAEVFSANAALSIFLQAKLSRFWYEVIRATAKRTGHNISPSYKRIQESKEDCYLSAIEVTETLATLKIAKDKKQLK